MRSGHAYDPTAFRNAAELIIAEEQRAPIARVYLPGGYYDVSAKWRFYTTKHERRELWPRTEYYSTPAALASAPSGSIAVMPAGADRTSTDIAGWTTVADVSNLMDKPTLSVIRRTP